MLRCGLSECINKIHGKEGKFIGRGLEKRFPGSVCLNSLTLLAIFP